MGQRPILKDDIVINVVEIEDDTLIVTKDEHKKLLADEDAEYAMRLAAWRDEMRVRQGESNDAVEKLGLARATASALKVQAAGEKNDAQAANMLRKILAVEEEIKTHEKAVTVLHSKALPAKPRLVRGKRWFHSGDVTVGPSGGNIGERWDGKAYVRPEKVKADAVA